MVSRSLSLKSRVEVPEPAELVLEIDRSFHCFA